MMLNILKNSDSYDVNSEVYSYVKDLCVGLKKPEIDDYAEKFFKLPKAEQDKLRPPTPKHLFDNIDLRPEKIFPG